MKFSVITVNKNNAIGLRKTCESVFAQKDVDFEYIVIDGNSTDGSIEVISELANLPVGQFKSNAYVPFLANNRIQTFAISEPDTGVFNAMNKGIKQAKGDYLLFLNSGDFFIDDYVLCNVKNQNLTEDILCGQCHILDKGELICRYDLPSPLTFNYLYKGSIPHQSTFIKRKLFDELGLYREDLKFKSDWEFWIRCIILGKATFRKLDVQVSKYNLDGISSNDKNSELMINEISQVFSDLGLSRIIEDYQSWENERIEMKAYYWIRSKALLNWLVLQLYSIAVKLNNSLKD